MPLSEHEQRLLEQMEKALYAEDPKFATSLRSSGGAAHRSKAVLGVLGILGGLGIAIMLAGAVLIYFAFTRGSVATAEEGSDEGDASAGQAPQPQQGKQPRRSGGFMDRMEERWRKRAEGDR
jgi:hypothetical protein